MGRVAEASGNNDIQVLIMLAISEVLAGELQCVFEYPGSSTDSVVICRRADVTRASSREGHSDAISFECKRVNPNV